MKGVDYMKLHLDKISTMSKVTKEVIDNFNKMSNSEFRRRYSCSKLRYYKRVKKYGDPYMNAPLAKLGRLLNSIIFYK